MKQISFITSSLLLSINLLADTFNVTNTLQLREALEVSATNSEDDTIILEDGIYKTTDDGNGTFIYLSNESNSLIIQGLNQNSVILSGDKKHQILNHQSTKDAPMKIERISFVDGNSSENGGAIYSDYSLDVIDSKFTNSSTIGSGGAIYSLYTTIVNSDFTNNSATVDGGAIYSKNTNILESKFVDNSSNRGAGVFVSNRAIIDNSQYTSNLATASGGGVYAENEIDISNALFDGNSAMNGGGFYIHSYAKVDNLTFINNSAEVSGGGFYSTYSYTNSNIVNNSFFKNNSALESGGGFYSARYTITTNSIFKENSSVKGGAIFTEHLKGANLIFDSNENSIFLDEKDNIIYNSIFIDNINNSIEGDDDTEITLKNNYLDKNNINIISYKSNTIFDNINIDFIDRENDNYMLLETSDLIDLGTTNIAEFNILSSDKVGNNRVSGSSIDIGPYEISLTKPIITEISFVGELKAYSTIIFKTTATASENRKISKVEYDFNGDNNYIATNTNSFPSGTYTIKVKVTDSEGEYSISQIEIVVEPLPFEDMTLEQKLTSLIADQSKLDSIIRDINFIENSLNTTVLRENDIEKLSLDWHLIGTIASITDMTIFDSTKIVWVYNNATSSWSAYSPIESTKIAIKDSGIDEITSILPNSGIWILK